MRRKMLYALIEFSLLSAIRSSNFHKHQRCYSIHPDSRLRPYDYSIDGLDYITDCLTLRFPYKMLQWLPEKRCLEFESIKEPNSDKEAPTLVMVGDEACPGNMSSPRQGRFDASCTKFIGTYKKEECRDVCYLIKACRAATYTDGDQTCRVCVQPLPSYQTDNVRGHTSYIRLPLEFPETSSGEIKAIRSSNFHQHQRCYNIHPDSRLRPYDYSIDGLDYITDCLTLRFPYKMLQWLPEKRCLESESIKEPNSDKQAPTLVMVGDEACPGNMSSPRQGRFDASCTKFIGTYKKEECRDVCYLIKACRAVTYTDGDQTCRVCVQPLPSYQTDNVRGHTSYIRLPLEFPDTSKGEIKGAWFRKNVRSRGESVNNPVHPRVKPATVFRCATRCLQDEHCPGFSITFKDDSPQCNTQPGGEAVYVRVQPPYRWW